MEVRSLELAIEWELLQGSVGGVLDRPKGRVGEGEEGEGEAWRKDRTGYGVGGQRRCPLEKN